MRRSTTGGIDLAAQPKNTGACLIDWDERRVELVRGPVGDTELIDIVGRSNRTGIDSPLGWPDEFVRAITRHQRAQRWHGASLPPDDDRRALRLRLTDREARRLRLNPLSVSADRIAVAAMRWGRIESELRERGYRIDRSGCSGRVVEVYPAGSLRQWGIDPRSETEVLVDVLLNRVVGEHLDVAQARHELQDCNRHQLDAFIAAITARHVLKWDTIRPTPEQREVARREGWIHLPTPLP